MYNDAVKELVFGWRLRIDQVTEIIVCEENLVSDDEDEIEERLVDLVSAENNFFGWDDELDPVYGISTGISIDVHAMIGSYYELSSADDPIVIPASKKIKSLDCTKLREQALFLPFVTKYPKFFQGEPELLYANWHW